MVRLGSAALLMGLAVVSFADDEGFLSAEDLKRQFEAAAEEQEASENRLKVMRGDNLKRLDMTRLEYVADGKRFLGVLLPNNQVAPAIERDGERVPACIDESYRLHPGVFNPDTGLVECHLESAKLLIREDGGADIPQVSIETPDETPQVSRGPKQPDKQPESGLTVVDEKPASESEEPAQKPSDSRDTTAHTPEVSRPASSETQQTHAPKSLPEGTYIPPVRTTNGGSRMVSYVLDEPEQRAFGIRRGTWATVKIERRVSSADPGSIELILEESVLGEHQDLPVGTILFARKAYNGRTERMDLLVDSAILPDGQEISVQAYAYDRQRNAGLSGTIIRDREGEFSSAAIQGGLAALKGTVNSIPLPGNALGEGVETTSDQLIQNEQRHAPDTPPAVIEVPPQTFYIQFSRSL